MINANVDLREIFEMRKNGYLFAFLSLALDDQRRVRIGIGVLDDLCLVIAFRVFDENI